MPTSHSKPVSEKDWQAYVVNLAHQCGWLVQHSRVSQVGGRHMTAITGNIGFPDLVLAHEQHGVVFAELKAEIGQMSAAQTAWRMRLMRHAEWYLWRPSDIKGVERRLMGHLR